jgi:hypothetical protein
MEALGECDVCSNTRAMACRKAEMTVERFELVDGPDKPALQRALTYPDRVFVEFRTSGEVIDAEIRRMDELSDGFSFDIKGVVRSGQHKGRSFQATYSIEKRKGSLTV